MNSMVTEATLYGVSAAAVDPIITSEANFRKSLVSGGDTSGDRRAGRPEPTEVRFERPIRLDIGTALGHLHEPSAVRDEAAQQRARESEGEAEGLNAVLTVHRNQSVVETVEVHRTLPLAGRNSLGRADTERERRPGATSVDRDEIERGDLAPCSRTRFSSGPAASTPSRSSSACERISR